MPPSKWPCFNVNITPSSKYFQCKPRLYIFADSLCFVLHWKITHPSEVLHFGALKGFSSIQCFFFFMVQFQFFYNCDSQDKLRWRSLIPASTWQGRNVTKERGRNVPVMRDGPQQPLKRSVMRCLSIYELCKGSRRQFRPSTLIQKKKKKKPSGWDVFTATT